ncbi:hypothetical protein [Longitalea arenae]|uniref:hypothetical protein n=1 Tax=Longitalea arenae TaxID=2812558 RepID=UPI001966E860|nr:hypothetical protein [Longitalea arenae]
MRINRWLGAMLLIVLLSGKGVSQQLRLGNNPWSVEKSAVLELQSANQGLLFTRITDTALINALNPPDGMVVYFTPSKRLLLRASGHWQSLASTTSIDTTHISNFYQKVRSLFSAGSGISYNAATGVITATGGASTGWGLTGNTVTSEKKLGTIDNYDLPFITNNTEKMRLSKTGNLAIGIADFDAAAPEKLLIDAGSTESYNLLIAKGSRNGYLQFNIQNESGQGQASTDIVATANNGTETTNYVNLGINGGGYNSANNILSGPNNGYLYSAGQEFIIGNTASDKNLIFFTGGITSSNERMRITSAGRVGVATTGPAATLDVAGTYKLGSSGTVLNNLIKTSFSINDNTSIAVGTTRQITASISGAAAQNTVMINPRSALPSGLLIAYSYISSSNTITVGVVNTSLVPLAVGAITFDVTLIQ